MMYEYRCPECRDTTLSKERGDRLAKWCYSCGGPQVWRRVFAVNLPRPMMSHFNHSVGQEVSSEKGFADALKRKGEEISRRTGIDNDLQPISPSDVKKHVTNEGLDTTNAVRRARGQKEIWV